MPPLRTIRISSGLSQRALARLAGVAQTTVTLIETGVRRPYPATRKRIADALGVGVPDVMEFSADLSDGAAGPHDQYDEDDQDDQADRDVQHLG